MKSHLRHQTEHTASLWGLIALAVVYGGLTFLWQGLTGSRLVDGSLGVLLGLFICSRPAANAVDLLFFERGALHDLTSGWPGIGWLALNLLTLLAGWLIIVIGATQFAARAA